MVNPVWKRRGGAAKVKTSKRKKSTPSAKSGSRDRGQGKGPGFRRQAREQPVPVPPALNRKPERLTIAIDGPSGAGKSTVARQLARRLNYVYIDTGAMYRSLALRAKG